MTDVQTDGRTYGGDCNIPDAFLKKRGDNNILSSGPEVIKLFSYSNQLSMKLVLLINFNC